MKSNEEMKNALDLARDILKRDVMIYGPSLASEAETLADAFIHLHEDFENDYKEMRRFQGKVINLTHKLNDEQWHEIDPEDEATLPYDEKDYLTWWETYDGGNDGPYIASYSQSGWSLRDDAGHIRHLKVVTHYRNIIKPEGI